MKSAPKLAILLLALTSLNSCIVDEDNLVVGDFEVQASHIVSQNQDKRKIVPDGHIDGSTVAIMSGNSTVCTGTTIGDSFVITAAHCVFDNQTLQFKKNLTLAPGLHLAMGQKPASRFPMKKIFIVDEYIKDIEMNGYTTFAASQDIALIQVKEYAGVESFSQHSPKLRLGLTEDISIGRTKFSTIAYTDSSGLEHDSQYFQNECYSKGKRDYYNAFFHDCDTGPASSGMALMSPADQRIYGIHTGGVNSRSLNSAAFITRSLKEEIDRIISGSQSGLEIFRKVDVNEKDFYGVDLKNNCDNDLEVFVSYYDLTGALKTYGPVDVRPGRTLVTTIESSQSEVYVHAKLEDLRFEWVGDYEIRFNGQIRNFMKAALGRNYKDGRLNFNCR